MSIVERPSTLRPPLKWAGGKRWQVPHLQPLWKTHSHRRLIEPFCGGLAVTLGLMPARALLNDANPHVINFYRWLQKGLRLDIPMENDETLFYQHRERFNTLLARGKGESLEAAAFFYYLNRTGFNGLCRFNRTGEFNVPFGRYARIRYTRDFTPYRDVFVDWTFTSTDMEAVPLDRDEVRVGAHLAFPARVDRRRIGREIDLVDLRLRKVRTRLIVHLTERGRGEHDHRHGGHHGSRDELRAAGPDLDAS